MRSSLLLLLVLSAFALAQDGEKEKKEKKEKKGDGGNGGRQMAQTLVFEDYDKDRDGKLKGDEVRTYYFDRSDLDGNGAITLDDFASVPEGKRAQAEKLLMLDRDKDGSVSFEEFVVPKIMMNKVDADKDGAISKQEADPNAALQGAGTGDPEKDIDGFMERFDKDKDGMISREEYTGPAQIFDRVDTDKDENLTRDEIAKFMQAAAKRGGTTGPADFVQRFDKNSDGRVTLEEFGGPETSFARLDANGDGVVTSTDGK